MSKTSALLLLVAAVLNLRAADDYALGPDSTPHADVPQGRVEKFVFTNSTVFPGTTRDGWVYVPAQYNSDQPAALMVFQDGHAYVSSNGQMRVPVVFDNLIHRGELPVTVGIFINPGHRGTEPGSSAGWAPRNNRSFEYDSLGDAYARFLIDRSTSAAPLSGWRTDPRLAG